MKKYCLSIIAILLVSVFVFAGCTKANSASLYDCSNLYKFTTNKYDLSEDGSTMDIFNEGGNFNITYSEKIAMAIEQENGKFSLLKVGNEYETLLNCATGLYERYKSVLENSWNEETVPQQYKSALYIAIQDLEPACHELSMAKQTLASVCNTDDFSESNQYIQSSFNIYLQKFSNLLEVCFNINEAFESLYTGYIVVPDQTQIKPGELDRFVLSAENYIAKYFYLKHYVNGELLTRFSEEKINDTDNLNYDKLFTKLQSFLEKGVVEQPIEADKALVFFYKEGLAKLESFKIGLENYEIALEKTSSTTDVYANYIAHFNAEAENFINYVSLYFINE